MPLFPPSHLAPPSLSLPFPFLPASLNQHEQKKRQQEVMKEKDEDERKERVRKTSALLQDMKKTSEKKQLEYRGITNSHAAGTVT